MHKYRSQSSNRNNRELNKREYGEGNNDFEYIAIAAIVAAPAWLLAFAAQGLSQFGIITVADALQI